MYPGDDPASMQKRDRTNAVMAQASGKRAVNLILGSLTQVRNTTIRVCRYMLEEEINGRKSPFNSQSREGRETKAKSELEVRRKHRLK